MSDTRSDIETVLIDTEIPYVLGIAALELHDRLQDYGVRLVLARDQDAEPDPDPEPVDPLDVGLGPEPQATAQEPTKQPKRMGHAQRYCKGCRQHKGLSAFRLGSQICRKCHYAKRRGKSRSQDEEIDMPRLGNHALGMVQLDGETLDDLRERALEIMTKLDRHTATVTLSNGSRETWTREELESDDAEDAEDAESAYD